MNISGKIVATKMLPRCVNSRERERLGKESLVPDYLRTSAKGPAAERFDARVIRDREGKCWTWLGHHDHAGYAKFFADGRKVLVHRWAYEHFIGPIPEDMQIDHACHVTGCVNPQHLRLVTSKQNSEHRRRRSDNTSGFPGASPHKSGRWQATVSHRGERIYLGLYDTAEEAGAAALAKRLELFTHNDQDRA